MKKEKIISILVLLLCLIIPLSGLYECPIYKFFGLYCPGCGLTRMLLSMIKLDFYQAFRYNPLMFILFFVLFVYLIICLIKKKNPLKINNKVAYVLLFIIIAYGIIRNIPTFDYLIPTVV